MAATDIVTAVRSNRWQNEMYFRSHRLWSFHHWLIAILLMTTAGLAIEALIATWSFQTDDAYITLRYAEHLAGGHGLVWNIGDPHRVEGYSNLLYVLLGAGALKLGVPPMEMLRFVGVCGLIATAALLYRVARLQVGPLFALSAPLLYVAHPFVGWWAGSGLETSMYAFWVVAAVAAYLRGLGHRGVLDPIGPNLQMGHRSAVHLRLAGLLVFLASLTRPEGPIVMVAFTLTSGMRVLQRVRSADKWAMAAELAALRQLVGAFAFPFAVYSAWRLGYFGQLLPNSVQCKAGYHGDPWSILRELWPVAAAMVLLAAPARRRMAATPQVLVWLVAGLYGAMLYGVAPVVAYGNRHFLAAFALLCVPASVGLATLAKRRIRRGGWVLLALAITIVGSWQTLAIGDRLEHHADRYQARMEARTEVARWLREHLAPGQRYVLGDVGLIGYQTPALQVIDLYCLNNPAMVRPPIEGSPTVLAERIMQDPPSAIVVSSRQASRCIPRSRKYRALMEHPAFRRFDLATIHGALGDDFQYFIYVRNAGDRGDGHGHRPSDGKSRIQSMGNELGWPDYRPSQAPQNHSGLARR